MNSQRRRQWVKSGLTFDQWPYHVAGLPFELKRELAIIRKPERERALVERIGLDLSSRYVVTHSVGSRFRHDFDIPLSIEIRPLEGFCLLDWYLVLANASEAFCVDSCVAHAMDALRLCEGRRHFHPWRGRYKKGLQRQLEPVMAPDWKVVL